MSWKPWRAWTVQCGHIVDQTCPSNVSRNVMHCRHISVCINMEHRHKLTQNLSKVKLHYNGPDLNIPGARLILTFILVAAEFLLIPMYDNLVKTDLDVMDFCLLRTAFLVPTLQWSQIQQTNCAKLPTTWLSARLNLMTWYLLISERESGNMWHYRARHWGLSGASTLHTAETRRGYDRWSFYSYGNSVCLSVRPSICLTDEWR